MVIKYMIYNPSGNITALVIGDKYNINERKLINDKIMEREDKVEQVGFLSSTKPKLTMAGGEFCGNAIRCATSYYIKKEKNIELEINNQKIKAGTDSNNYIWCEIPIEEKQKVIKLDNETYKIKLNGINIVVVKEVDSYDDLKRKAKEIIKHYNVEDDAVGIMFLCENKKYIKIYPVVWVKEVNTLFLENACGSGTIGVSILESWINQENRKYRIMQPSGEFLETSIIFENEKIVKAILKGKIKTDNKVREIRIRRRN